MYLSYGSLLIYVCQCDLGWKPLISLRYLQVSPHKSYVRREGNPNILLARWTFVGSFRNRQTRLFIPKKAHRPRAWLISSEVEQKKFFFSSSSSSQSTRLTIDVFLQCSGFSRSFVHGITRRSILPPTLGMLFFFTDRMANQIWGHFWHCLVDENIVSFVCLYSSARQIIFSCFAQAWTKSLDQSAVPHNTRGVSRLSMTGWGEMTKLIEFVCLLNSFHQYPGCAPSSPRRKVERNHGFASRLTCLLMLPFGRSKVRVTLFSPLVN